MSVQTRASLALTGSTSLDPTAVLGIVKEAAGRVKGGGASLLTTGIQNLGAAVHVEREHPGRLEMSINSGKRIVELCTFTARATDQGGTTQVRIGGLETFKSDQATVMGFIPVGPKMIAGMAPYKRFLDEVATALRAADGKARVSVAEAG